jgi:hypothetical protein
MEAFFQRKFYRGRILVIAEQSKLPNRYTETWIYLKPKAKGDLQGVFLHKAENRAWRFENAVTLLELHEQLFSSVNYPQAGYELREIVSAKAKKERKNLDNLKIDATEMMANEKPTFIVNVQYRQNASWQGTIKWVEGDIEKRFRSTLELIRLMDSVVGENNTEWT